MAIRIKGASAPGWYLPVEDSMIPYLWTGLARAGDGDVLGYAVSISKQDGGPRPHGEWLPSRKIKKFGNADYYRLVATLPDTRWDQDIRDAVRRAEALADQMRAKHAA